MSSRLPLEFYWGLRDYKIEPSVWGGDLACEHEWGEIQRGKKGDRNAMDGLAMNDRIGAREYGQGGAPLNAGNFCLHCGAWRGCLGLEPDMRMYVAHVVEVFREVRRVLRKDGTLWLNLGDSYCTTPHGPVGANTSDPKYPGARQRGHNGSGEPSNECAPNRRPQIGLKHKDLCGVPWRVAFALQEDGWYLRQDIIWSKWNPMPESVRDRCCKSHEYLFLLSKSARYYFDIEAVKEDAAESVQQRTKRSVWHIATEPFKLAHFATFPPALVEPCIKAGTSERGCCSRCGAPWKRQIETTYTKSNRGVEGGRGDAKRDPGTRTDLPAERLERHDKTLGWSPSCQCAAAVKPCVVLDPFGGAGTVGLVADRLQRDAVLIEISPAYVDMARKRIEGDAPLFAAVAAE